MKSKGYLYIRLLWSTIIQSLCYIASVVGKRFHSKQSEVERSEDSNGLLISLDTMYREQFGLSEAQSDSVLYLFGNTIGALTVLILLDLPIILISLYC